MSDTFQPGLVSVIIPAFNAERYLAMAIESVLQQTYRPIEIIVVDDGSTDGTANLLRRYGSQVHVVTQANTGLAGARNSGLRHARGEFIAFLDADDAWQPAKIERQVALLRERSEYVLVHTRREGMDEAGRALTIPPLPPLEGSCLTALAARNVITISSVLVRASLLSGLSFATGMQGVEDWDLMLTLAPKGPFAYIPDPLLRYRIHANNMSKSTGPMLKSIVVMLDRFLARETDPAARVAASTNRHVTLLALANVEYELGHYAEARSWFARAGRPRQRADLQRYLACYLPNGLRSPLRSLYRSLFARGS